MASIGIVDSKVLKTDGILKKEYIIHVFFIRIVLFGSASVFLQYSYVLLIFFIHAIRKCLKKIIYL